MISFTTYPLKCLLIFISSNLHLFPPIFSVCIPYSNSFSLQTSFPIFSHLSWPWDHIPELYVEKGSKQMSDKSQSRKASKKLIKIQYLYSKLWENPKDIAVYLNLDVLSWQRKFYIFVPRFLLLLQSYH